MQAQKLLGLLALCGLVQACAPKPVVVTRAPPLPPHLGPPPAAACAVAPFHVADLGRTAVVMSMSNEGGYCAATLTAASGRPFDAPLMRDLPLHGTVRVVKYNGRTSVEYTPLPGYVGVDNFTVRLIVKGVQGYTTLEVAATMHPPEAPKL